VIGSMRNTARRPARRSNSSGRAVGEDTGTLHELRAGSAPPLGMARRIGAGFLRRQFHHGGRVSVRRPLDQGDLMGGTGHC